MKIGIPRAMAYYKYCDLWQKFFAELNMEVVLSPESNREILKQGANISVDESCLPAKLFMGHVASLKDKCDMILIPRIENFGKNESVCVKFNALYDIVKNTLPEFKILDYNIDETNGHSEQKGFMEMAARLNKSKKQAAAAYKTAKEFEARQNSLRAANELKKLYSDKTKILIVSHSYNSFDMLIGAPSLGILQKKGVDIIFADRFDHSLCRKNSKALSKTLYWSFNKELAGAVELFKNQVDGIIFLSAFPCGPDSLVNELLLRKIKNTPTLNLIIDELSGAEGLETRLESFLDIILYKKDFLKRKTNTL